MNIFNNLFEIFFPKNKTSLLYDKIDKNVLEKKAVRIFSNTNPKCIAPFPYNQKLIRNAVHTAKYQSHERSARLLGEILVPYVLEEIAEKRMFEDFINIIVIPVPLHKKRVHERGFNQSERIAKAFIKQINDKNITLNTNSLIRNKNTKSQTMTKNKKDRYENMKNAFKVVNAKNIYKKDIILLDDVITTGATLGSAKQTLEKAGAKSVLCVAVAH